MGGDVPSPQHQIGQSLSQYIRYLPELMRVTSQAQPGVDMSQALSSRATTPITSQTGLTNLQDFGMPYAQMGQQITDSNAQAGARTNLGMLQGAGGQAAMAADQLNRTVNPEWYNTRSAAGGQASNLVNSINLGGLSGGETAAVERSLNQSNTATGNLGLDNATNTVSNAMNFGNALQAKRTALGQALDTATNFMGQAQNTSFNPVGTALSQPNAGAQGNFGTSQFAGVSGAGNQAFGSGANVLNNIAGIQGATIGPATSASYQNSPAGLTNSAMSSL